jgi:hypothetical protein
LDSQVGINLAETATRTETIEYIASGDLAMSEINLLLDRHIGRLANLLETGFDLSRNTFWLGRVSNK